MYDKFYGYYAMLLTARNVVRIKLFLAKFKDVYAYCRNRTAAVSAVVEFQMNSAWLQLGLWQGQKNSFKEVD